MSSISSTSSATDLSALLAALRAQSTSSTSSSSATTADSLFAALAASASGSTGSSSSSSGSTQTPGYVETAAKALGMSSDDVMSELSSGKSLTDIASAQGVSKTDLLSALKAGAPKGAQGAGGTDSTDGDAMVESLADTQGVAAPGGPPLGGGTAGDGMSAPPSGSRATPTTGVLSGTLTGSQQSTLSSLSTLLGTNTDSLLTSLASGTSLSSLLSSSGTDLSSLSGQTEAGLLIDTSA